LQKSFILDAVVPVDIGYWILDISTERQSMLRQLSAASLRQPRAYTRSLQSVSFSLKPSSLNAQLRATRSQVPKVFTRPLSDKPPTDKKNGQEQVDNNELVLTPGQKVVAASRLSMYLGMGAAAIACLYYIGKELIPTKMSPNSVFNNAVEILRENNDIKMRFGDTFKCYGRDHGGHREGRRNFIE
jgi:import inner membrane translocase subunit TIM21